MSRPLDADDPPPGSGRARRAWHGGESAADWPRSWSGAIALFLLAGVLVTLPGLGSPGLVMMEGMVAYIAERMLETGELLVPELYGEVYTFKPPLVYWLTALSFGIFGTSEWALRLPNAGATLLMGVAILVLVGRASRRRVGLLAALAAVTGGLWSQQARLGEFNAVLAALVGIAIAAACHNLAGGRSRSSPWIWLLCYLALTGGFLAKGALAPMAFFPGLLGAAIFTRQTRQLWSGAHLASAALFVALVGLYLALLWNAAGWAAFEQPVGEAQRRGFEWSLEMLGLTLTKPLIIASAFLPWSLAWPWARRAPGGGEPDGETTRRLRRAAWGFLALGILTFMAVPTHETRYYLPLAVPAAIVTALGLERLLHPSPAASRLFHGTGLVCATLVTALAFLDAFPPRTRLLLAAVGVAGLTAVQLLDHRRGRLRIASLLLVSALLLWAAETWALRPYRARFRVLDTVARELDGHLPQGTPVWALGAADVVGKSSSLYYYLDHPVRTFRLGPLPPAGSYVVLTASQLRELERVSPTAATRLDLVRRVHHPWRLFLLYRVKSG